MWIGVDRFRLLKAAERFLAEADKVRDLPKPEGPTGVVSDPPPVRIAPARAWIMWFITLPPFVAAMFNVEEGVWGAVTSTLVLFLALGMVLFRSRWLARAVVIGSGLTGAAFLADYVLASTPISLLGAVVAGVATFRLARMTIQQDKA